MRCLNAILIAATITLGEIAVDWWLGGARDRRTARRWPGIPSANRLWRQSSHKDN